MYRYSKMNKIDSYFVSMLGNSMYVDIIGVFSISISCPPTDIYMCASNTSYKRHLVHCSVCGFLSQHKAIAPPPCMPYYLVIRFFYIKI